MPTAAEEWAGLYLSGRTLREIAVAAGVDAKLVHEELRAAGVPMRRPCPKGDWHDRVPPLWAEGLGCTVIAERLGVDRSSVHRLVRRLGLRS